MFESNACGAYADAFTYDFTHFWFQIVNATLYMFIQLENWRLGSLTWHQGAEFYLPIGYLFLPSPTTSLRHIFDMPCTSHGGD